jgi:CheY-like chemotaxis protein
MPVMDGLTATKAIRKINGTSEIPIIAVTAHGKQFFILKLYGIKKSIGKRGL